MIKKRLTGLSLFASAGIGETYFKDVGIDIKVANELLEKRADLYRAINPETTVVCGDITKDEVFSKILASCPKKVDFILASPPCQGMSVAGKNRCQKTMEADERNYLITYVVKAIKATNPDYILVENVPALLKLELNYSGKYRTVLDILQYEFGDQYEIDSMVVDSADYGVPQTRLRAIIKMSRKGKKWSWPLKKDKITVRDAIGHLPSLEAGERSEIKWHFARKHSKDNILWMKHTPTGKSAFSNPVYYPQKKDGTRVKGYESSYRRIRWDAPAPTITIRNDCIASQRNVHPGRLLPDGTYSDARVLTPLSLPLILTKTICTIISASIPYPSLTVKSMTIPKQSNESSVAYLTASVPNTACRLSRTRTKHPQDKYGLMRKAVNLPVTMCIVKICVKPLITAVVPNISKNIYREKDILLTSLVSIGRYDYHSTNTLQD